MFSLIITSPRIFFARIASTFTINVALIALALFHVGSGASSAGERITFETPPVQPSAFKVKRAKAQGKTLEPQPGIVLSAILSSPKGDGMHPAVVIIPESVEARRSYLEWADYLNQNGFVTLIVESLSSRGKTIYKDYEPMNLLIDSKGGLDYLSALESVDPQRISILSFGGSAWFVLRALDGKQTNPTDGRSFNAGVAFYPQCDPQKHLIKPVLILGGGKDNLMSVESCRAMVELNKSGKAPIQFQVYPDATHYFDNISYSKDPEQQGEGWEEPVFFSEHDYNPDTRADAESFVLKFLNSVDPSN